MTDITVDSALIGCCGLYCVACGAYMKGKCGGCASHGEGHWCKVLKCCREHEYRSCAECTDHDDVRDCRILNNIVSKLFALIFRSDRPGCLDSISEHGYDAYARMMADQGRQSIKRRR